VSDPQAHECAREDTAAYAAISWKGSFIAISSLDEVDRVLAQSPQKDGARGRLPKQMAWAAAVLETRAFGKETSARRLQKAIGTQGRLLQTEGPGRAVSRRSLGQLASGTATRV